MDNSSIFLFFYFEKLKRTPFESQNYFPKMTSSKGLPTARLYTPTFNFVNLLFKGKFINSTEVLLIVIYVNV